MPTGRTSANKFQPLMSRTVLSWSNVKLRSRSTTDVSQVISIGCYILHPAISLVNISGIDSDFNMA